MTLKQTITQEPLHSVDDPAGLEELFQRHKHSKGPFFLALAEATTQLELNYQEAMQDLLFFGQAEFAVASGAAQAGLPRFPAHR